MKGPFKIIAGHQVWVLDDGNNTDYLQLLRKRNVRLGGFNPTIMILSELTEEQAKSMYNIKTVWHGSFQVLARMEIIEALKAKGINVRAGDRLSPWYKGGVDNSPGIEHIIIEKT